MNGSHYVGGRCLASTLATTCIALLGLPALFAGQPAKNDKKAATTVVYSGQAIALQVDGVTHPTSGRITVCDTGMLASGGGVIEKSESDVNIASGGLTIDDANAQVSGIGPEAAGETTLSGYHVEFISDEGVHVTIEADYIHAEVSAAVQKNGKIALTSQVQIDNLRVNGRAIAVTGRPNQRVDIPESGGYLIINEQSAINGDGSGDIGVSAITFDVCHCINGHMGFVHAGISANGVPEEDHDCGKVTGGGWIVAPDGAKGTFGMSGGVRRGEFWGHLNYIDHGTGMQVRSTAVTGYTPDASNANGATITYAVTIDGVAGTARLHVVDNGEPGRNDIFDLTLSTGYHAAGDLGGSRSGGGNIQMHKCPPGWE